MRLDASVFFQIAVLLGAASFCALLSNATASPARQLVWTGQPWDSVSVPITPPGNATPELDSKPGNAAPTGLSGPVKPLPGATGQPPSAAQDSPEVGVRFPADPSNPIREISSQDALTLFQAKVPFLDARRSVEFNDGHVVGARNLPVWEAALEVEITAFEATMKAGPQDALVLYCSGGDCEDASLLAAKLAALGYRNLCVYLGGYPDWVQQGRPIAKGGKP